MINLLPPPYKKELAQEQNMRLLAVLGTSFVVFLVCLALMLLIVRIYLKGQTQSEKAFSAIPAREAQLRAQESKKLQQTNANFLTLSALYAKRPSPTAVFSHLASDLPADISISALEISSSKVSMQGFAPTRDTLVAFKQKLLADPLFESIDFPLSNLVSAQDITFVIRMNIHLPQ